MGEALYLILWPSREFCKSSFILPPNTTLCLHCYPFFWHCIFISMLFWGYYFNLFNAFGGGGLLSIKICNICLLLASLVGAQQILDMLTCTE